MEEKLPIIEWTCSVVESARHIVGTLLYVVPAISNETHHCHNINPIRTQCHAEGCIAPLARKTKWVFKSLSGGKLKHRQNDSVIFNKYKERHSTWKLIKSTSQMCIECLLFTRYCVGSGNSKICKVGVLFPGVYNLGRATTNILKEWGISWNWESRSLEERRS